jgi:phosphate transport system permease protein
VVSIREFFFSIDWFPTAEVPSFGIGAFILGSIIVTVLALLFSVPIGVLVGVFLSEMAKGRVASVLGSVVQLLASIPSVIYGIFGVVILAPVVRTLFGGSGYSLLSAAIILGIMTLPTIISITRVSIRAVPQEYREGSLALGSTNSQTIIKVLIPAARSGILAGVVLGMGRAIGETMAVLMVGGNAPNLSKGLTDSVRTLTMNIVTDMSYADGYHLTALFTTAIALFIFILANNMTVHLILRKSSLLEEI